MGSSRLDNLTRNFRSFKRMGEVSNPELIANGKNTKDVGNLTTIHLNYLILMFLFSVFFFFTNNHQKYSIYSLDLVDTTDKCMGAADHILKANSVQVPSLESNCHLRYLFLHKKNRYIIWNPMITNV